MTMTKFIAFLKSGHYLVPRLIIQAFTGIGIYMLIHYIF